MTNLLSTLALASLLVGGVAMSGSTPVESDQTAPVTFATSADEAPTGCCMAGMMASTDADYAPSCCSKSAETADLMVATEAAVPCCSGEKAACDFGECPEDACPAGECPFESAASGDLMATLSAAGGKLLTLTSFEVTDAAPAASHCAGTLCPTCETVCCDEDGNCLTGCCE